TTELEEKKMKMMKGMKIYLSELYLPDYVQFVECTYSLFVKTSTIKIFTFNYFISFAVINLSVFALVFSIHYQIGLVQYLYLIHMKIYAHLTNQRQFLDHRVTNKFDSARESILL